MPQDDVFQGTIPEWRSDYPGVDGNLGGDEESSEEEGAEEEGAEEEGAEEEGAEEERFVQVPQLITSSSLHLQSPGTTV